MPIVASFRGITVYIYFEIGEPHHLPHFHVYYGEYQASFSIDPPNLLAGALPRRQLRFILAWAELYQAELRDNWHRIQSGKTPKRIAGI